MSNKIKVVLLYLLALVLPFNTRYIFNFEKIENITTFKEHLSLSIYPFDILFLCLFLLSVLTFLKNRKLKKYFHYVYLQKIIKQPLFFFIISIIVSTLFNRENINWYGLLRLGEVIFLFLILRNLFRQHTVLIYFEFILFTSGVIQVVLAISQFILQKSIGLQWLGESIINPNMYNVAKFSFENHKLIRAYGTFPHPNLLGAFLLLSLASTFSLILFKKHLLLNLRWRYRLFFIGEIFLIFTGILLSYSRIAILAGFILIFAFLFFQRKEIVVFYKNFCRQLHIPFFLRTTLAIMIIFFTLFATYNIIAPRLCWECDGDHSIILRQNYNQVAKKIISSHYWTGIGVYNFVPLVKEKFSKSFHPWQIQPVHNLYLLITSEIGLFGLLSFLALLGQHFYKNIKLSNFYYPLNLFFILILLMACFDHYFWTLPQGQFIFWITLALISVPKIKNVDSPKYHFRIVLHNFRKLLNSLKN